MHQMFYMIFLMKGYKGFRPALLIKLKEFKQMKQIFIIILVVAAATLTKAQTVTVYTNTEEKHYLNSSSIGYDIPSYSTFVFKPTSVTMVSEGKTITLTVDDVEIDTENKQVIYRCKKADGTDIIFFLRRYFVALDLGEPNIIYIFRIYSKF